jgi:hypothetical protein
MKFIGIWQLAYTGNRKQLERITPLKALIFIELDGMVNPGVYFQTYEVDWKLNKTLAKQFNDPLIKDINFFFVNRAWHAFNQKSADYLKDLCEKYDAKIVVNFSWCMLDTAHIKSLLRFVDLQDYVLDEEVKGKSPVQMIHECLAKYNIDNYLVLTREFHITHMFKNNSIQTFKLFTKEDYNKAVEILEREA